MNIAIFGYSGFIGSHLVKLISKDHKLLKINARNISNKLSKEQIFGYLEKTLVNPDIIINCCANTNPKTNNDIFINENLSKLIQEYILHKGLNSHFFHFSSINVLIESRIDKYTISKINAERRLIKNFTSIIRLPLIINFDEGKKGDLDIFYKYLNLRIFPFYPMIYPGNIYKPIEINNFCNFFSEIIKIDNKKDIYNLMGKETKNMWELFEIIAKKHNKKIFKIKTKIINKILPKFIKENFFKKNSFLGQFLSIDQSFINEKDITII